MKILVPIKRVVDYNVKVRPLSDNSNVDLNNVKMAVNPFCEIALEEAVRLKEAGNATEVVIEDSSVKVTREIDGGLQTLELTIPAIITTDLRLNEPRYASLPNIMKAKKKELNVISASEMGIDINSRTELLSVELPPSREAGIIVETVDQLVDKLKNEAKVIQ